MRIRPDVHGLTTASRVWLPAATDMTAVAGMWAQAVPAIDLLSPAYLTPSKIDYPAFDVVKLLLYT